MELVLIRHGQPSWVEGDLQLDDPGLTPLGRRQADAVARRIVDEGPVDHLIASSARRARETAEPFAALLRGEPVVIDDLREMNTGLGGLTRDEARREFEALSGRPLDQWAEGWPRGESFDAFRTRVVAAIDQLLADHGVSRTDPSHSWSDEQRTGRIVVVAHGGTNAVVVAHLLGIPSVPWEWERFVSGHTSVTRLRTTRIADAHVMGLTELNSLHHLDRTDRTR